MHDVGANYVVQKYLHKKYTIHPLGVDLRKHEVIIEDELPDYIVEKNGKVFCFDVKSKSSIKYFGWANERAIVSYKKLVKACNVPIFLIFTQVVSGKVRGEIMYSNVEDEPIKKKQAWDGNIVWIFRWEKGLGDI